MRSLAAFVALALVLAGCSSGNGSERPAGDVNQTIAAPTTIATSVGASAALPDLVTFKVTGYELDGDSLGKWLRTSVRVENHGKSAQPMPTIGIVCANGPDTPGSYKTDSTISLNDSIPAGSYREGILNLLRPLDKRVGDKIASRCLGPAWVQATPAVNQGSASTTVQVRIPDQLVTNLNG